MKVIIAGSRSFSNTGLIEIVMDNILKMHPDTEFVSGTANGPDTVAINYCKKKNIKCHEFPADWNKHGKKAGPLRNEQMAEFSDALVAFHCNDSRGTKNMIENMQKRKRSLLVFDLNGHIIQSNYLDGNGYLKPKED